MVRLPRFYDWPGHGFAVHDRQTDTTFGPNLELPGLAWGASTATLLPHNQVLFELASDPPEVVLMDIPSRRLGVVAVGSSPVATLAGEIPCPQTDTPSWELRGDE